MKNNPESAKKRKMQYGQIQWKQIVRKLSPYTILKGIRYLKHFGPKEFWIRMHERFEPEEVPYADWYPLYVPGEEVLAAQRKKKWKDPVLLSVCVPVYKTPENYLRQMLDSCLEQTYPHWEMCIANGSPDDPAVRKVLREYAAADPRIRVRDLSENKGIAGNTNEAFAMASGVFICLLDHDDLLAPNALYETAAAVSRCPDCDLLYTDEDKIRSDTGEHYQPHLKPDYNPDLLRSNNYICHMLVVRRSLVRRAGGIREGFEGAQDYDFILRCTEMARRIVHIPEILYHWRTHSASTADNPASKMYAYEAGKRAIEEHLSRTGISGTVTLLPDYGFYRVKYPVQGEPLVSVIIPNKDQAEMLKTCIESLTRLTSWPSYEILVVENNSTSEEIFRCYREIAKDPRIRLLRYKKPFNYSAINNFAASRARGDYLLFLNNDVTVRDADWMSEMLGVCQRPDVGAVGAKLLYPDGTIQHAGCVIGMGGIAGAMFVDMPSERSGYLHKASILQDLSAVTAACMMTKKEVFLSCGGFEEKLTVAFNDMDYCLRLGERSLRVVYDPYACLTHWESRTRGAEDTEEKVRRFQSEIEYFRTRWIRILKEGDPCYNKNLSLSRWDYSLKPLPGMGSRRG